MNAEEYYAKLASQINESDWDNKIPAARVIEFLKGLNELTKRTGVAVDGCGCCDSPYLIPLAKEGYYRLDSWRQGGLRYVDDDDEKIEWAEGAE